MTRNSVWAAFYGRKIGSRKSRLTSGVAKLALENLEMRFVVEHLRNDALRRWSNLSNSIAVLSKLQNPNMNTSSDS